MLDLPSGYIFVEEITEDCQYETWQEKVTQVFKPLGLTVRYLVSDRAKAIVKLALKDIGTAPIDPNNRKSPINCFQFNQGNHNLPIERQPDG